MTRTILIFLAASYLFLWAAASLIGPSCEPQSLECPAPLVRP